MDTQTQNDHLYYLFGVIPAGQPVPDFQRPSFQALAQQDLVALVESVPASEFSSEALEQAMTSLDWVACLARKHQAVLELAMRCGPVVPARLCTLYSSADSVRTSLATNRDHLAGLLGQLQGCQEWGVKMRCDEGQLRRFISASRDDGPPLDGLSGSAAWIRAKQAEARLQGAVEQRLDRIVEDVEDVLEPLVVFIRELALPPEGLRDDGSPIVLNLAVLLRTTGRHAFDGAVGMLGARHESAGVIFDVTGPWPPYSFCGEAESVDDDEGRGPRRDDETRGAVAQGD